MRGTDARPRRSVLYMPGSNTRALEKARTLDIDALVIDLEDGVAPEAKQDARAQAVTAARSGEYGGREVVIRVNGLETPWGIADVQAVGSSGADAILVPKVETAETLAGIARLLKTAGAPAGLATWIMTESPRGVLALDRILGTRPEISVVVMGTSDLAKDLRVSPLGARQGLTWALSRCVLTARAHHVDIIDGVHLALDDDEGYHTACLQGRQLGFDGKSLIHPRQIDTANAVFGISEDEAAAAREVVDAWQVAREQKKGLAVVRGQLVEQLHVDAAERTIRLYEATKKSNTER